MKMKTLVMNSITFKIPLFWLEPIAYYFYMTALKIGILNVIEFITSIFILFQKFFTIPIPFLEINYF